MKHPVATLEGALLDAAVAKAEGKEVHKSTFESSDFCWIFGVGTQGIIPYEPSVSWAEGGPIIERERIMLTSYVNGDWEAFALAPAGVVARIDTGKMRGPTPLIAAMRAYVFAKLGEEVELP